MIVTRINGGITATMNNVNLIEVKASMVIPPITIEYRAKTRPMLLLRPPLFVRYQRLHVNSTLLLFEEKKVIGK